MSAPLIQQFAEKFCLSEPVNGSWIQALVNSLEITPEFNQTWLETYCDGLEIELDANSPIMQSLANYYGATETVNGTWLEAILSRIVDCFTCDSNDSVTLTTQSGDTSMPYLTEVNGESSYFVNLPDDEALQISWQFTTWILMHINFTTEEETIVAYPIIPTSLIGEWEVTGDYPSITSVVISCAVAELYVEEGYVEDGYVAFG